jgi:2-amino-4-hydroxy-6-hydroxymethyldihydropteridine diphosphokinase
MHRVYLLLGSNLGDRKFILKEARNQIELRIGTVEKQSSIYETEPWGIREQPEYLNQALEIKTDFSVIDIAAICLDIEKKSGRVREEKWQARTLDIDILFFDKEIIQTKELTIPHLQIQNRKFALLPMEEIAADYIHPVLKKTIKELLNICSDNSEVVIFSA